MSICIAHYAKTPLIALNETQCHSNRCVFKSRRNWSGPTAGSRKLSGREFQTVGPATAMAKARAPKVLRRTRGTMNWQRLADRRCWRPGTVETGTQYRQGTTGLAVPENGGPSPPACTAPAEEHLASADRRAVAVTDHGRTSQSYKFGTPLISRK